MSFIKKISAGLKKFAFGEDEVEEQEQIKGKLYLQTPKSRVKFESELKVEEDFDRAIKLLTHEREILFSNKF